MITISPCTWLPPRLLTYLHAIDLDLTVLPHADHDGQKCVEITVIATAAPEAELKALYRRLMIRGWTCVDHTGRLVPEILVVVERQADKPARGPLETR